MASESGRLGPRDLIIVGMVAIAWGGAFTAGRIAVAELTPHSVAAIRYLLGSALLLSILHAREDLPSSLRKLDAKAITALVVLALFSVVGYNLFLFAGLRLSTAINGSVLAALAPLLTALLAVVFLRDPLRPRQAIGMIISFSGLLVLVSRGSLSVLLGLELNVGDLLLLASMICFAAQSIAAKRAMTHVSPRAATALSCAIGSIILLPLLVYDLATGAWGSPNLATWSAVAYLGSIATVLAYYGWFFLVSRHGAGPMSPFLNIVPVCGAIIGIIFGERLLAAQVIAGALVLFGVMVATTRRTAPAPAASPSRG